MPPALLRLVAPCLTAWALLWPAPAWAIPIRVRGEAVLRGQMRFDEEGRLELRAQLTDGARLPIERGAVRIDTFGSLRARDAAACSDPPVPLRRADRPGRLVATTNPLGELCVRWQRAPATGRTELRFDGDPYHGSADLTVRYDRSARRKLQTTLEFEPRPQVVDLDRERAILGAELRLQPATAHAPLQGLPVTLTDAAGRRLAGAASSGNGKLRFEVPTAELAPPGTARLRITFAGTEQLAAASDAQTVTLRAVAPLRLAEPIGEAAADEPAAAVVRLEPSRGVVDDGVVEALFRSRSVGSAPVVHGRAELVIRLDADEPGAKSVTLRYLPASPWWRAGTPLSVVVPMRPPSHWGRAAWSVLLLLVAWWTVRSWRRSRRRPRPRPKPAELAPGVHVVATIEREPVWRGVVRDAHEGHAIADATVVVRVPSLETGEAAGVLARCRSDDDGRFRIELDERPRAADIVAEAAAYSAERRRLPAPGVLQVNLLTRRRSVLRRFVTWARGRGGPFATTPEPTPGEVRAAAQTMAADEIADWAAEVESIAFGPEVVDADAERRLREREPRIAPPPAADRPAPPSSPTPD